MQSLKDKLLKAGVVTEEQAKKASEAPPKMAPVSKSVSRPPPASTQRAAPQHRSARPVERAEAPLPKFAPLPGSKQAQREESRKQLELDKQIRERVYAAEVPQDFGATVFYFVTRKNKLRRLTLTEAQAKKLETGELAVVERPDPGALEHALVPAAVAEELSKLSEKTVRFFNKPGAAVGFLSEEDIHKRATEADEPAAVEAAPASAPAPAATQTAPAAKPEGTFITIRRAPPPSE